VPALEPVAGLRVVAAPVALDAARWRGDDVDVIRIAPDEALGLGAIGVDLDGDLDAIVESETGFVAALLDRHELAALAARTDWPIPILAKPGTLVQGKIAGIPAKLLVGDPSILLTLAAYADELEGRLAWH
jgi:hypothetical protein